MDNGVAQELGERVNDHLRYKLVQLRVQKVLQVLAGSTAASDHARYVDSTLALWKPAPVSENRRSTSHTQLREDTG